MAKSVLITGATRGLGKYMAKQFATRGYKLALTGRKMTDLEQLAREIQEESKSELILKELDVADTEHIAAVIEDSAAELGGLDIVVVNAGIGYPTPVASPDFAAARKTIEINVISAMATTEAAVALFRKQGRGQVVGITSVSKVRGQHAMGAYCASKAAFARYLESVRCETLKEPIVITELAPGFIDTDLNSSIPNRPFLVTAEKGTRIMVDLIEKEVAFSYVPPWPWKLVAQVLKILPNSMIAKM